MKAKLVVAQKDGKIHQEVPFDKNQITIGRKPGNDLHYNRPEISGNHAMFFFDQDQFYVCDLGSTNGTLLNGVPLIAQQSYLLQDRDEVSILPYRITFVVEEDTFETMIDAPGTQPDQQRKVGSGTMVDVPGKVRTGTEEHVRKALEEEAGEEQPAQLEQEESPSSTAAQPSASNEEEKPQQSPRSAKSPEKGAVASQNPQEEEIPIPEVPVPRMMDFIWLGAGAIFLIAAIGLIFYLLFVI